MVASSSCPGRRVLCSAAAPEHPATKTLGAVGMDDEYAATHKMHGGMTGNTMILFHFLAIVYGHIMVISRNVFQAFRHPSRLSFPHFHTAKEISGNQSSAKDDSKVFTLDVAPGSSRSITGGAQVAAAAAPPRFIMDSGASVHATDNRALLSRFTRIPAASGHVIRVANGDPVLICGIGAVVIPGRITLNYVLYVPGLSKNIVSVSKLAELDYNVDFTRTGCFVRDAGSGELVGQGRLVAGLFQIDFLQVPLDRTPPLSHPPTPLV